MRIAAVIAGTLVAATILCAAGLTAAGAQEIFNRGRREVLSNLDRTPRYTCVETVTREMRKIERARCSPSLAGPADEARGPLVWHDRLRLDVAVIDGDETFSWAGARKFETHDIDRLAGGGATGTGDFSGFLTSVFGNDARHFRYMGNEDTDTGPLARFEYEVPLASSHYAYRTRGDFKTVPYTGWFLIDPASGALRRLVVLATEFDPRDEVCRVEDTIDYQTAKIGDGEFMLPKVSVMDAVYTRGTEARNETQYSGCREYTAESKIRFDDTTESVPSPARLAAARQPLPKGVRVNLALETPINAATSAAGDEVIAQAMADSKSHGAIVIHRGDRFHGRIFRLEQYLVREPYWILGLRFDSVVRDGVETPVALQPLDDGVRTAPPAVFMRGRRFSADGGGNVSVIPRDRAAGSGYFAFFQTQELSLNSRFHSAWVTAALARAAQSPPVPQP